MASDPNKKPKANIFRSERWKQDHSSSTRIQSPRPEQQVCKIAMTCGACKYINSSYEAGLTSKYEAALQLFRQAGLLEGATVVSPVPSPRILGYRAHAKLAVRPANEALLRPKEGERFAIGLFQPDSHQLVHIDTCPLHRSSINRLLPDLKAELEASSLSPYHEASHAGQIRYIAVRAAHLTEELMLTFVCTDESVKKELKAMILRLRQKEHVIVSAFINVNSERTNSIFGFDTKKIVGADGLRESLCGLIFEVGPTSFFQVNPWQAEHIYRRVEQLAGRATEGEVAWDLYCGTGQISLLLGQQGYRTLGIEENPQAIGDAEANVQRNQITGAAKPYYISGRVEDLLGRFPSWSEKPALIVANPSRRGLAASARQMIREGLVPRSDSRLIYVSCEAVTLVRDLQELLDSGRRLRQLECFDMFPFTEKLEWLAVVQ